MAAAKLFARAVVTALLLTTTVSSIFVAEGRAQEPSSKEVAEAARKIARLVEDNYVFAERGRTIAAHFMGAHARGRFGHAKDWREFSSIATDVLREFGGDRHLYVRFGPEQVKELTAPRAEAADEGGESSFFYGVGAREKNYGINEVRIIDGNIGYIKLSEINISEKSLPVLYAAMRFVSDSKTLVIDLRDNGGGGSEVGAVLESFFLPKNVALLEFRSRGGGVEVSRTVAWLTEKKYERPVFLIVNNRTGSAAEAFAYALQAQKRAKVVGQRSAGAAYMNTWYAVNEYLYASVSTAAPVLPGTELSWEGKGVQPDYTTAPGDEIEFIKRTAGGKK